MKKKECTTCNTPKPLDDFYNAKKGADGKASVCKVCHNRKSNATKTKRYQEDKEYREQRKKTAREYYHENNKERYRYDDEYRKRILFAHNRYRQRKKACQRVRQAS